MMRYGWMAPGVALKSGGGGVVDDGSKDEDVSRRVVQSEPARYRLRA